MNPQAPAQPQGAPEAPQGGGPVSELVSGIHEAMQKLASILPDEDKAGLEQLIQAYESFVQQALGSQGPKAPPATTQSAPQGLPMEAGAADVKPVA